MDLMELLPSFYRVSPEVKDLQQAFGGPTEELWQAYDELMAQLDVSTSTWGLQLWEKQYGLDSDPNRPIEERRARILSKMRGQGTTTVEMIQNVAQSFVDGLVETIEFPEKYCFKVQIMEQDGPFPDFQSMAAAIQEIRPAHLDFYIDDHPRPISLPESNTFLFEQAAFFLPISNHRTQVVLLDGRRRLDGTFLLDQAILGMELPSFVVALSPWWNSEKTTTQFVLWIGLAKTKEQLEMGVGTAISTHHSSKLFHQTMDIQGLKAMVAQAFHGSITIDSMYHLDGSCLLNGSRKLNASIRKETL